MKLLGCKRIAETYEIFQDAEKLYLVNEVYHGGDFTKLRQSALHEGVELTESWWHHLFKQCLRALEFMQALAMVHCDIKEQNLMVKTRNYTEPEVVVVDFGIANAMGAEDTGAIGGTPGYIPPETLEMRRWFPCGDVFSLGVVIFQMTANMGPSLGEGYGVFQEDCETMQEVFAATVTREPPWCRMPQECPGLIAVTRRMLDKSIQSRPRAPNVLTDPWFAARPFDYGELSGALEPRLSYGELSGVSEPRLSGEDFGEDEWEPRPLTMPRRSEPLQSKHPLAAEGNSLADQPQRLSAWFRSGASTTEQ